MSLRPDVSAHLSHFEALYVEQEDPWRAASDRDEAYKRRVVNYALGQRQMARGLEIGCGNGISTRSLALRFLRLVALDGSERAVTLAKRAIDPSLGRVRVEHAALPCPLPPNRFDAVVATEILYYLPRKELTRTLTIAFATLRRGGRFVSTHHLTRFADAECDHATLICSTRAVFGPEIRQISGHRWRCYVHIKR